MMMNGLTTPPAAERRINEDLENSGVARIVLWHGFALSPGWGLHLVKDSVGDLDSVIGTMFGKSATFGEFDVLERRPLYARPNRLAFVR